MYQNAHQYVFFCTIQCIVFQFSQYFIKISLSVKIIFLQLFIRMSLSHILQKFIAILANEGFLMVTSNVMPDYTISVVIIQNGKTSFVILASQLQFTVVGLRFICASCWTPIAFDMISCGIYTYKSYKIT